MLKEIVLLPDPTKDRVPRGRDKLDLEERGFVVTGHRVTRSLNEQDLLQSLEKLFEHVLVRVTSSPKDQVSKRIVISLRVLILYFATNFLYFATNFNLLRPQLDSDLLIYPSPSFIWDCCKPLNRQSFTVERP